MCEMIPLLKPLGHVVSHPPILSPEFFQDMNPTYDWLRENDPVHLIEPMQTWFVSRYDDCVAMLLDDEHFSLENMPITNMWHPEVKNATRTLFVDEPDHSRFRGVLQDFFKAPSVLKRESMVAEVVNSAIARLKDQGDNEVDIEKQYAYTIPIDVLSLIMGLPKEDYQRFHDWAPKLNEAMIPELTEEQRETAGQTVRDVSAYLSDIVQHGNLQPYGEETVLSLLKSAMEQGIMREEEIVPQAVQLYIGGHETTLQLIGLCIHQLLKHPQELEKLKAKPALVQRAVDETVRVDGVSQVIVRRVAKDYGLHGVAMKENDMLFVGNGAANRDPSVFEDPLTFNIERRSKKSHLGFGKGIRYCLGNILAKLETRLAINALLAEFPSVRLPDDHAPDYNHNMMMRGLLSLRVVLE